MNIVLVYVKNGHAVIAKALFVNAEIVMSTQDPEKFQVIEVLAKNFAKACAAEVETIPFPAKDKLFSWEEIKKKLLAVDVLTVNEGDLDDEYEIHHSFIQGNGSQGKAIAKFSAKSSEQAIAMLINAYNDIDYCLLNVEGIGGDAPILYRTEGNNFRLNPFILEPCSISIGNASVEVSQKGDGIEVNVYPCAKRNSAIASTFVRFEECANFY